MAEKNIIELTPFRADLTRALVRRAERLLAATDLADEVAALEPLEAYYIIREIGLDQALSVILHLSPEQLGACVDLDCWHRYDFALESFAEWLTAFSLDGPETLASTFFSLDYVVQLLFLSQSVIVYDADTDEVPQEKKGRESSRAMTPDGFYLLELKTSRSLRIHPFTVLDALYQYDLPATHQLLSEVRVGLPTEIEEEALHFRNGRMQDLGFASPDEAAVLFSRPDVRQPQTRPKKPLDSVLTRIPSIYAVPLSETTLLQRALSLITDQEFLSSLEQEIVWTINSAIIAYGETVQDTSQIADIAERVRDTLSLGLESLLAGPGAALPEDDNEVAAKASDLLYVWHITDLFRHGFAATMGLRQEAGRALLEPGVQDWYNLPDADQSDEPDDRLARAFLTALLGRHPLRSGFDLAKPEKTRAFCCLAEIDIARLRLRQIISRITC